nr:MAG TPA: hypothetical protein [Caudoviricetes sp.]
MAQQKLDHPKIFGFLVVQERDSVVLSVDMC